VWDVCLVVNTDELSHSLKTCQPSWIFTTPALYRLVSDAAAMANILLRVFFYIFTVEEIATVM